MPYGAGRRAAGSGTSTCTSDDVIRAVTVTPTARPRSSTASRVTSDAIRCGPAWTSTRATTPSSRTPVTIPVSALPTGTGAGEASSGASPPARSRTNRASPAPSITRFPEPSRPIGSRRASAHRRTVSGLTLSRRAAWPMLYVGTREP
ncbi:hypothetical protein Spa2297_17245 [Streptomyces parvulus]|uniref:Uncharacterized protein n=1 Tax=Streptomyces parvulus TaxID=146923 RepID=A0A191V0P8_9ACTN|nr:hypothetical protein Spa2297_17245 [Streptomyces parvulus]